MITACIIAAVCILVAGLFAVIVERTNERDAALAELARREREHKAQADMEARLTDPATATTVHVPLPAQLAPVRIHPGGPRPDLSIVPPQRDGGHDRLPVADGDFPVHTAIDDDDLTALMRATEE